MPGSRRSPSMTEHVTSLDAWAEADTHTITLPSGAVVRIRLLELPDHFVLGQTPDSLRIAAFSGMSEKLGSQHVTDQERMEALNAMRDYHLRLLIDSVIEPVLDDETVHKIPERDRSMLIRLQLRHDNTDAAGRVLPFEALPRFLGDGDESGPDESGTPQEGLASPVPARKPRRARAASGGGSGRAARQR